MIVFLVQLLTYYPARMRTGKVIGYVVVVVVDTKKSPNLGIYAPERVVSTTNMSNLAKNWLQYAQNRVVRSARVTNRVFQLAIVATPIDCAHHSIRIYFPLMHTTGLVRVGKGRQQHMSKLTLHDNAYARARAGYVLLKLQLTLGACARVTVVVLSVCLCICLLSSQLLHTSIRR